MIVGVENEIKYQDLLYKQNEPLFLEPDGVRTRYCIGWNGKGRYLPGTLKVTYNGLPCNITEEDNGIFYNFSVVPSGSYTDFKVSYISRPLDYAFATGHELGGYKEEEYFLFPNWNNAKGCGDAFWVGRWVASINGETLISKKGTFVAISRSVADYNTMCKNKDNSFHVIRNREYCSMLLWADYMGIEWKGNFTGTNSLPNGLDGDGTVLPSECLGTANGKSKVDYSGYAPATWYHNHNKNTGIEGLYGNKLLLIDGCKTINNEYYIFDENNENYVPTGIYQLVNAMGAKNFNALSKVSNDILNECLPVDDTTYEGEMYYPNLIGNSANINENSNGECINRSYLPIWDSGQYIYNTYGGMFNIGGNYNFDYNRTTFICRSMI